MEVSRIIAEIDAQISKLQQARELLAGTTERQQARARAGPREARTPRLRHQHKKRKLSPEGRKRIADAMKQPLGRAQESGGQGRLGREVKTFQNEIRRPLEGRRTLLLVNQGCALGVSCAQLGEAR